MTLADLALEVLEVVTKGRYQVDGTTVRFGNEQEAALDGTGLYRDGDLDELRETPSPINDALIIRVVASTTQQEAHRMAGDGDLALLNFASARNPGGGFLGGAKAQEEDICRCSGLFPCLLRCMEYYEFNRRQTSLLYSDRAIYSPRVPFFKTSGTSEWLAQPFFASVITAPAPNTGPYLVEHPNGHSELARTFERRWQNVLCIARQNEQRRLLLGAWGCGAFQGDPQMAAQTAQRAIDLYGGEFDEIVFAIPGKGKRSKANLEIFQQVFSSR